MQSLFNRSRVYLALVVPPDFSESVARARKTSVQLLVDATNSYQTAQFIDELFVGLVPAGFQGYLQMVTQEEGVVSMGLLMTGNVLTPFRHIISGASHSRAAR